MQPHHMYHQQYQYLPYHGPYNSNSRRSSSTLSSMMEQSHQQLLPNQQSIQLPPQTPFDMTYGASMLPRQLLIGSPFVQTPINGSPSRTKFNNGQGRDGNYFSSVISGSPTPLINAPPESARRRGVNYVSKPPLMRSLSVSSSSTSLNDYYSSTNGKNSFNSRSVILHDLPSALNLTQFLNNVKVGPIENCHFVEEELENKSIALSFVDNKTAKKFYQDVTTSHRLAIALNAPDLKISWTLSSPISPFVLNAINNDSATRNVYIGNLSPNITKEFLEEELLHYGNIDTIDYIADRQIAFVHFSSIASAIKAVEQLPLDISWNNCKIFYGKDRCSQNTPSRNNANTAQENTIKQFSDFGASNNEILNSTMSQNTKLANMLLASGGSNNIGNRCVYLGNLHPQTSVEEICNVVRGGLLQSIRLIIERHICFITFIDPLAAVQFFATTSIDGILVHGRKLKVGWGKHSGPLPNPIVLLVTAGLSRNLYIGVINEEDGKDAIPDEATLRADFSEYGEIEQINFFKDGLCAFVNFLNISSAIKCVEDFQKSELFTKFEGRYRNNLKISFGKDRCGNPPKPKKMKKAAVKKTNKNVIENNDLNNDEFSDDQSSKTGDALVFASMGITSKSLSAVYSESARDERERLNQDLNTNLDDVKEELNEDDDEEVTKSTTFAKDEVFGEKEEEHNEHEKDTSSLLSASDSAQLDYDTSDSDSVSIVIGNNDSSISPMTSKPSENTQGAATPVISNSTNAKFNKKNSATQFRLSNNNSRSSSFSYDNLPIYNNGNHNVNNGTGFNSRQSSKSQLNKYYGQGQLNAFATSGSQVMAQYLAQSQHDNLLYATHVLTEDRISQSESEGELENGFEDAPYYYDEFQPPHPQQYAKMYTYPVQQYPYILASPSMVPQQLHPMSYGHPQSPSLNGRGGRSVRVGGGFNGGRGGYYGGNNNNNNNGNNKNGSKNKKNGGGRPTNYSPEQ